ncbi:MAG TPA: lauroyl acyltransferase [Xanthomonadaceae bacterium]|nr:lauroyl acyltransferase [Xanthomonadaceae bacterium]
MPTKFAARLLHSLATALARLPWPLLRRLADGVAWWWRRLDARESRVARRNLELAYPGLMPAEREALHAGVLRGTARQAFETLRIWTRSPASNLALIREQDGVELFDAALASGRGLIIAAPHHGNWELLNQWLASRTGLCVLYRAPRSAVGEEFLRNVRRGEGDRVTQVRAEGPALRQLFTQLRAGGTVGILPDQQPKAGDGVFAPFFGIPALTMTLLSRLAERTDAIVLFAWCERIGDGSAPAYALHVEAAPPGIADADPVVAATALNAKVEHIARRDPAQYQWTYKRYTLRPSGQGQDNPYRDLERRRR